MVGERFFLSLIDTNFLFRCCQYISEMKGDNIMQIMFDTLQIVLNIVIIVCLISLLKK